MAKRMKPPNPDRKLVRVEYPDVIPPSGGAALDAILATVTPGNFKILHYDDGSTLSTFSRGNLEEAETNMRNDLQILADKVAGGNVSLAIDWLLGNGQFAVDGDGSKRTGAVDPFLESGDTTDAVVPPSPPSSAQEVEISEELRNSLFNEMTIRDWSWLDLAQHVMKHLRTKYGG